MLKTHLDADLMLPTQGESAGAIYDLLRFELHERLELQPKAFVISSISTECKAV